MTVPVLFTTTGTHKSGNTWLVAMLFELEGVGGYGTDPDRGLGLVIHHLLQQPAVGALLRDHGVPIHALVERLLCPPAEPCPPLADDRAAVEAAMGQYLRRLRFVSDWFLDQPHPRVPLERLVRPVLGLPLETRCPRRRPGAIGCPSKHLPASFLARSLPGWKIVQLLRDPRDVLVSAFYHGLGTLSPQRLERLTERDDRGRLAMRCDWRRRCFAEYTARLQWYYEGFPPRDLGDAPLHRCLRYEDLRADPAGVLAEIFEFVAPGAAAPANLLQVVERYAFERLRGRGEQRNSFVRKAAAGDWRRYIDGPFARELGRDFAELVVRLGYEPDDGWIDELPDRAAAPFDFRRFRPRMSAATVFRAIWMESPDLQARYPRPMDVGSQDCFAQWLRTAGVPEVDAWFRAADELVDLWEVDVAETVSW